MRTPRNVLEWQQLFLRGKNADELVGMAVDVTGFVHHDVRSATDEFWVARLTTPCCTVHAWPVGMLVKWSEASALEGSAWVRVLGKFAVSAFMDDPVPAVVAYSVAYTAAPPEPYLPSPYSHGH